SGADIVTLQEFFGLSMHERLRLFAAYPYLAGCPAGCDLIMLSKRPWIVGGPTTALSDRENTAIWGQTTAPDGKPVDVMTLHYLGPVPPHKQAHQRVVVADVGDGPPKASLIVAGDTTLAPWTAALKRQDVEFAPLTRRERALFTWPALIARPRRPSPV